MSKRVNSQEIKDTKSKKLKTERPVDKAKLKLLTLSLNKKDILEESIENKYSTDGSIDTITEIFQPILA